MKLKQGTIKRIHVNRQALARVVKTGKRESVITIQTSKGPLRTNCAVINGPSAIAFPGKQLKCGARVWIETTSEVFYEGSKHA